MKHGFWGFFAYQICMVQKMVFNWKVYESLIPALECRSEKAAEWGRNKFVMGMA